MLGGCRAFLFAILLHVAVLPLAAIGQSQPSQNSIECCAAVEANIAALESEALGRSVSFQAYGQINRAMLLWNDGINSKWSFVDNTTSSTRLGFVNQINLGAGLVTGFRVEGEFIYPASFEYFDPADVTHAHDRTIADLRQGYWYLSDDRLGRLSVGHQWSARPRTSSSSAVTS
jgi:hypothetical protein